MKIVLKRETMFRNKLWDILESKMASKMAEQIPGVQKTTLVCLFEVLVEFRLESKHKWI